jgi:hypothetical protein
LPSPGILSEYDTLSLSVKTSANSARKAFQKKLDAFLLEYPMMKDESEISRLRENEKIVLRMEELRANISTYENHIETMIEKELTQLVDNGFAEYSENVLQLSKLGESAAQLNEVNPLFSKVFEELNGLTTRQLVGLFSCFTDMKCEEPSGAPFTGDTEIKRILHLCEIYEIETTYDFIDIAMEWTDCEDEVSCKWVLQRNEIFLGDFVKGMVKIVNIARELEKVALFLKSPLMESLSSIPNKVLKYMVNNQSLYI